MLKNELTHSGIDVEAQTILACMDDTSILVRTAQAQTDAAAIDVVFNNQATQHGFFRQTDKCKIVSSAHVQLTIRSR
jgi:hypothetical protein